MSLEKINPLYHIATGIGDVDYSVYEDKCMVRLRKALDTWIDRETYVEG